MSSLGPFDESALGHNLGFFLTLSFCFCFRLAKASKSNREETTRWIWSKCRWRWQQQQQMDMWRILNMLGVDIHINSPLPMREALVIFLGFDGKGRGSRLRACYDFVLPFLW